MLSAVYDTVPADITADHGSNKVSLVGTAQRSGHRRPVGPEGGNTLLLLTSTGHSPTQ